MHTPFTSAAACAAICDVRDPTLRNLQITLSYHDIAQAVSARICTRNAPWVAFAAWASKQAGRFIRLESLPSHFGPLEPLLERFDDALDDVSAQISEGNFKVYRELAPLFARFLEVLDGPDPGARLDGFLAELRPGPSVDEGQDRLRQAFTAYWDARQTPDPGTRAQLILLANGQVGVHEQTRLQAQIAGSMLGALERLKARAGGLADTLGTPRFLRRIVAGFTWKFEEMWREVSTGLMGIALPGGTMTLGRDVPPLPDGRMFPAELAEPDLPALRALVEAWDPTPNSTAESAAEDWSDLADRMHFILDLFRSRQQDPAVLGLPFSPSQAATIRAGRIPPGPL
ncbi:MAG: hypothetical protein R3F60_15240 [bacterium]